MNYKLLKNCTLCPRNCNVNRLEGEKGYCGAVGKDTYVAKIMLHKWEEPCISGESGSGAVFFCGCGLRCVFCQNIKISRNYKGTPMSASKLANAFFDLQKRGANNINLVTPTHYVPQIIDAVKIAKNIGLTIPIVYNTSGYDNVETIKLLNDIINIYLTDFKYFDNSLSKKYSKADNYFENAILALDEMVNQAGKAKFDKKGIMQKGIIVRHLVLPSHTDDSKALIKYLYERYGNKIYFSIMNQYTPMSGFEKFPELSQQLRDEEYEDVIEFAENIGIEQGFIQEGGTVSESFIPDFDS